MAGRVKMADPAFSPSSKWRIWCFGMRPLSKSPPRNWELGFKMAEWMIQDGQLALLQNGHPDDPKMAD